LEGYYVNDCDDRVAVSGDGDAPFDAEFVFFDLETTAFPPKTTE
jgi:DNA polymerase-3 subunit alpha (Gram-positive type)